MLLLRVNCRLLSFKSESLLESDSARLPLPTKKNLLQCLNVNFKKITLRGPSQVHKA